MHKIQLLGRIGVLFVLLGTVAGCTAKVQDTVDRLFGDRSAKLALSSPEDPRYCYRTLGKVNCYSTPLPGREANRLVGFDGPAPRSTAGTGPLRP